MVNVKFYSAGGPSANVELSGTFGQRVVTFYGAPEDAQQFNKPILLGDAQDITWITNSAGVPLGGNPAVAVSGQLNNVKWVSPTQYSYASGAVATLPITQSGRATLIIEVSDTGNINVSGAKLYAYNGVDTSTDPANVWVLSSEIIDSSIGMSGNGDTSWALINASQFNYMVDRTVDVGYPASGVFYYLVALSARPKLTSATSGLKTFGLRFSFDYS
jgi:hypothetical protein